jgi:hypothetical protein
MSIFLLMIGARIVAAADRNVVAQELHISRDQLDVTLANLATLGVFFEPSIGGSAVGTTPFGYKE